MTTATDYGPGVRREDGFYAWASVAIALTVTVGFGLWGVMRRIDYGGLPLVIHLHAAIFASWVLLYVIQSWLGATGSIALHRRLGWFACGLSVAVVAVGILATTHAIAASAVPPFFGTAQFLMLNSLNLATFAGLIILGAALRRRKDWHQRLMYGAAVVMVEPAFGRLLPLPLLGAAMMPALVGATLLFLLAGAARDLRADGRVHPAYGVAIAAHVLGGVLIGPLASALGPMLLSRL